MKSKKSNQKISRLFLGFLPLLTLGLAQSSFGQVVTGSGLNLGGNPYLGTNAMAAGTGNWTGNLSGTIGTNNQLYWNTTYSLVVGDNNEITNGAYHLISGYNNKVEHTANFVSGAENQVCSSAGAAIGYHNYIGTYVSQNNLKGCWNSFAIGLWNNLPPNYLADGITIDEAQSNVKFAFGYGNLINKGYSMALGNGNIVNNSNSVVIGNYSAADAFDGNATLAPTFVVGNGIDTNNRSNAIVVRKNGAVEINGTLKTTGAITMGGTILNATSLSAPNVSATTLITSPQVRVGTGITGSPTQPLYVKGDAAITGNTTVTGNISGAAIAGTTGTFTGAINCPSLTASSSLTTYGSLFAGSISTSGSISSSSVTASSISATSSLFANSITSSGSLTAGVASVTSFKTSNAFLNNGGLVAMGSGAYSSGSNSIVLGTSAQANGSPNAIAIGTGTLIAASGSSDAIAIGNYNVAPTTTELLVIGNGTGTGLTPRRNAMTIQKSGTVQIPGNLSVGSVTITTPPAAGDIPMGAFQ